jgi:hypothetical protein
MEILGNRCPAFTYTCFGLIIGSEFECPDLLPGEGTPEVNLRLGRVPEHLEDSSGEGILYETALRQFLLRVRNVSGYLVRDGAEILVDPAPGVDPATVRLFLMGTAFGALLHQRGLLPLHASAIAIEQGAMVLAGRSGSGKSTLAAVFQQRGYKVLADDLCAVCVTETPFVQPGSPGLMLWADALGRLNVETVGLRQARPGIQKYCLPPVDAFAHEGKQANTVFFVDRGDKTEIKPVEGRAKVLALAAHTYRRLFSSNMKLSVEDSRKVKAVARQTRMFRMTWPQGSWRVEELADLLLKEFEA